MSYLNDEREIYTNVFGQTTYNPKTGKNAFIYLVDENEKDEPVNHQLEDLIVRETKMGKTIYSTERAITAVTNPLSYLEQKKDDLVLIKNQLVTKYRVLYPEYLNRYHDPEIAYKRTMSEVNAFKAQLMSDHHYEFPTQIKGDKIVAAASKTETKTETK